MNLYILLLLYDCQITSILPIACYTSLYIYTVCLLYIKQAVYVGRLFIENKENFRNN